MCSSNIIHKLACNNGLSSLVVRPDIGKQFSWLVLCREFSSAALFYLILFSFLVSKENLTHLFIVCSRIWFQPHPVQILTSYKFFWQVHDSLHVQMFSLIYIYIYIYIQICIYLCDRNWRYSKSLKIWCRVERESLFILHSKNVSCETLDNQFWLVFMNLFYSEASLE